MAKARAKIQKAYRERKKLREGDKYLKKETCRVMKYYNPSSSLAETDRKKRNKIAAIRNRRHRLLVKDREQEQGEDSEDLTESGCDSSRLIVKLPVNQTTSRKRRTAKALERAKSRFKRAEKKIENLNKKCKKNQKVIERLRNKISRVRKPSPLAASTPNSKTNSMVESLNITPKRAKSEKRQLLIGNVLIDEISKAKQKNKSSVLNIIAGKVVKKYRCLKGVSQSTGLSRGTISKYASKTVIIRKSVTRRCQKEVTEFFNRNDNSKTNPGKKDSKKCEDGETKQTKVLTDYLANLHQKFLTENPTYELSLATFC
ncbi:hypothetical protein SNE40_007008 [Patella caerulea]|uniref:Uncharacterized protein n=1 Tax=Patella caerulea TaxID=87958 RepID=A0AAN8PUE9_PATCE